MREVLTADGSVTFHSDEYGETYHSVSGAVEEAFEKHAKPAHLENYAAKGAVRILDVCFGLGYNSAAALDKIFEANMWCKVEIVGLENDPKIIKKIESLSPRFKSYHVIKDAAESLSYSRDEVSVRIILGDARETIKNEGEFDVIFHDAFSPKKCPELWTEDFFKEIRKHIAKDGVLTTYSCARAVRENLKNAGFSVEDGPCVGRRAPSTIARPV